MAGLMLDPKYSDLTLECDGEKFSVHKSVVLAQSVVLEKACQAHWKEGSDNVIQIKEFDAQTVRRMVEFLYTGDYDQGRPEFANPVTDKQSSEAEDSDSSDDVSNPLSRRSAYPALDIKPLEAGIFDVSIDAYQPPSLSEPGAREWGPADEAAANDFIDTFSPHLCVHAIADYYMMNDLKRKAVEKIKVLLEKTVWSAKGFLAVAKEAFETTVPQPSTATDSEHDQPQHEGETLREIIVYKAFYHLKDITQTKDFARMDLNPEYAALLLQKASNRYNSVRAELKHQEKDNHERWLINCRRILELINQLNYLQAQNTELEDSIKRIQKLTTCQDCDSRFNVWIRREGQDSNDDDDDDDDSSGGDYGSDEEQEKKVKKYDVGCKNCRYWRKKNRSTPKR